MTLGESAGILVVGLMTAVDSLGRCADAPLGGMSIWRIVEQDRSVSFMMKLNMPQGSVWGEALGELIETIGWERRE